MYFNKKIYIKENVSSAERAERPNPLPNIPHTQNIWDLSWNAISTHIALTSINLFQVCWKTFNWPLTVSMSHDANANAGAGGSEHIYITISLPLCVCMRLVVGIISPFVRLKTSIPWNEIEIWIIPPPSHPVHHPHRLQCYLCDNIYIGYKRRLHECSASPSFFERHRCGPIHTYLLQ